MPWSPGSTPSPSRPATPPAEISEADVQRTLIEAARLFGWLTAHFRPAMTKHGWVTPVAADGKGFPDLLLVQPSTGRIAAFECKAKRGKTTPEQDRWLDAFRSVPDMVVMVVTPASLDDALSVIAGQSP
jgi:hypothetical protein